MNFFAADKECWKCVSVLKGDGSVPDTAMASDAAATLSKARYLKLGPISHPNQVPYH